MRILGISAVLLCACQWIAHAGEAQEPERIYLGPEAATTVRLDTPTVLYRFGDEEGPGSLEQGDAVTMAPVPAGGILIYTAYYGSGGPIQHFRDGELVRTFGRVGQGPGEYSRMGGITVDSRTGVVWVHDRGGRMVSFTPDGGAGATIPTHVAGMVMDPRILPDGSLVVNGPGGVNTAIGHLIHRYDFEQETWSSHHPVLRDSAFNLATDRRWLRRLAVTSEGKVVAVSLEYEIEILDPERDFAVETVIRRRPASWPEHVLEDYGERSAEDPLSPPYYVDNAWVDAQDRLWVLFSVPDDNWRENLGPDPRRPWEERSLASRADRGMDALFEVFDLSTLRVLGSWRLDPWIRYIVGPGRIASYAGDLPYPQFEVIEVPFDEQGR